MLVRVRGNNGHGYGYNNGYGVEKHENVETLQIGPKRVKCSLEFAQKYFAPRTRSVSGA